MARSTKRKGNGGGRRKKSPVDALLSGIPTSDLHALMTSIARLSDEPGDEALDLAQQKAFDAMEASTPEKRVALAREALALSPRCADAYLVLAHEAQDASEALDYLRRAVAAGAEALGETAFKDDVGLFWDLIETRPYMRARQELALALWQRGDRDEAVLHCQDMLRLNPNDNQGIRYLLMEVLLALGRDAEAAALLRDYKKDGSAAWAWSDALLAFRRTKGSAAARKALIKAIGVNAHVPAYLLDRKKLPPTLPDFIGMGDENEAVAYVYDAASTWTGTPGAKAWVAEVMVSMVRDEGESQDTSQKLETNLDRIDEAILALLVLGLHDGRRVWKTFDWSALDRLHARGLVSNPASRAKSLVLTEAGLNEAMRLHRVLFARTPPDAS